MPDKLLTAQTEPLYRFLTWGGHHLTAFIPAVAAGGLGALAFSLIPLVAGQLFTHILPSGNQQLLQYFPPALAILMLIAAIAGWAGHYVLHRLFDRLILNIRTEMFEKLLASQTICSDFSATTITIYFFQLMEKLHHDAVFLGINLSRDSLTALGLFIVIACLNLEMSLLIAAILAAIFLIGQLPQVNTRQQGILAETPPEISRMMHKTLQHYRAIRLDQGHMQEIQNIRHSFKKLQLASLKQLSSTKLVELLAFTFLTGMITIFLYYLLQQITLNRLTVGNTVAFLTAVLMLVFSLKRLSKIRLLLKQCNETLSTVFSLLDRCPGSAMKNLHIPCTKHAKGGLGKLRFEYIRSQDSRSKTPDHLLNLEIEPGMKIALTNSDASINRRLADLVCGFIRPISGRIIFNDQDARQINQADLCGDIAWIAPDRDLLNDTVAANIAYGATRCSTETTITAAARASQAAEFIRKMPHGLQTQTVGHGTILSDDQRQRILIARGLLKNPAIVILDETTACFDTDNAALLLALHTLIRNRTVLILSSRPVMLDLAERIFDPAHGHGDTPQ